MLAVAIIIAGIALNVGFHRFCSENCLSGHDNSPDRQLLNGKQTKADIRSSERNGNVRDSHDIAVRSVVPPTAILTLAGQVKVSTYVSHHDLSSRRKESGLAVVNSYYSASKSHIIRDGLNDLFAHRRIHALQMNEQIAKNRSIIADDRTDIFMCAG